MLLNPSNIWIEAGAVQQHILLRQMRYNGWDSGAAAGSRLDNAPAKFAYLWFLLSAF